MLRSIRQQEPVVRAELQLVVRNRNQLVADAKKAVAHRDHGDDHLVFVFLADDQIVNGADFLIIGVVDATADLPAGPIAILELDGGNCEMRVADNRRFLGVNRNGRCSTMVPRNSGSYAATNNL